MLAPAIVAAAVSYITTWWVIKNGKSWKILDDPAKHKHAKVVHTIAVPRGGGVPIFLALAIGGIIFLPWETKTLAILLGAFVLMIVGFLDDRYEERVSPYARLGVNVLAALLVIGSGVGIAYITNPMGGIIYLDQPQICFWLMGEFRCLWILSDLFAMVWLVWMQNIVGWSSGVDGQLPGFVVVAAITVLAVGMKFSGDPLQFTTISLAALTAGAYAGFMKWNWYPQKIIPGYGGKSLAGFLLGVLAILSGAKVGTMLLVLGVPIVDAVWVIIKRIKEGRIPVWGGREHLHHYLLDKGWGKAKIATFYMLTSMVFGFMALQLHAAVKYFTMATVILIVSGIVLWFQYWSTSSKRPDQDSG